MSKTAIGSNWKDVRNDLFTQEEIAATDLRVAIISELIRARKELGISQKQLEELKCFRSNLRPKEKQIKDSDIESIKELRTQGLSYREISQQTSWSKATVCRVLNGVYD